MLSGTNGLSSLVAQPLILTPTRLKNTLEENKKRLNIFVDLQEGEKLGRVEEKVDDKIPENKHLNENIICNPEKKHLI